MKMNLLIGIIGTVIVVGGVVYYISKTSKKTTGDSSDRNIDEGNTAVTDVYVPNDDSTINDVKVNVINSISERHSEAKRVMNESVQKIYDDTVPNTTKNDDLKKDLFNDLDNI